MTHILGSSNSTIESDSKIHKLELLLIAETKVTDIREHTNNLQETILLEKQGITRTDRPKLVF